MTPQDAINYVWLAWLVSWFTAGIWSARTVERPSLGHQLWYRVTAGSGMLLLFGVFGIRRYDTPFWRLNGVAGWFLAAIVVAGMVIMWWARLHLGRLWSGSITRKAGHHIIDTGPYAIVRHPIYTGLLVALAATVCVRASVETLAGV